MADKQNDEHDDGGAAAEDAAAAAGLPQREYGEVEVSLDDGSIVDERSTKHSADEHEEVATHDARGRAYTDEEREALRASRREEKRNRRNASREREERLRQINEDQQAQISQLTQRLQAVEQRGSVGELQALERQIQEATQASEFFKAQMAEALKANQAEAAVDYSARMTQAGMRAEQLTNVRAQYLQQRNAPPPLDPRQTNLAQKWMAEHSWYNPQNPNDPDAMVALALDQGLHRAGRNPNTQEYWDDLSDLVDKYLPHRKASSVNQRNGRTNGHDHRDDDDDDIPTRREERRPSRTPSAGGAGNDTSGKEGTFRLSKERVEALQQAGVWDDPKKRQDAIKRYRDYDRAQASAR